MCSESELSKRNDLYEQNLQTKYKGVIKEIWIKKIVKKTRKIT